MPRSLGILLLLSLILGNRPCDAVDLRMLSGTATNASQIQFHYEVLNGPLPSAAVPVSIYRSADTTLDPQTDVLLAETVVQHLATGEHSQTVLIPNGGLAINPQLPFVFIVADSPTIGQPQGVVTETNEANNLAQFRKHTFAVVVHGLTFGEVPPPWVDLMSAALTANGYDAVLPVDWAVISHAIRSGVPQEFGPELADEVLDLIEDMPLGPKDCVDVHWIGHSRGTVVVSQALLAWKEFNLPAAISGGSLKLTLLDPHPAKNRSTKTMSVNQLHPLGPVLALVTVLFQAIANDPDVIVPVTIIDESELYFQRGEWFILSADEVFFDYLANFWGDAPILGIPLSRTYNITRPRLSHFEVPNYYIDEVLAE